MVVENNNAEVGEVGKYPERVDETDVEMIAAIAHTANRAHCISIGDYSQPLWDDAPAWQQDSVRAGVIGIYGGGIKMPSDSHASWLVRKAADGWKYGEVKDAEAKTHPCMVPFDQLPPEHQAKDVIFFHVIDAMLKAVKLAEDAEKLLAEDAEKAELARARSRTSGREDGDDDEGGH